MSQGKPLVEPHVEARVEARVTVETLEAFAGAWNAHDADLLMSFMTSDCVFDTSSGPYPFGSRFEGAQETKRGYAAVWEMFPDARWNDAVHFVDGDRGCSEWTFTGTKAGGTRVEVRGCDLFTFVGGKIKIKDSYRKNVVQPSV
jgi:ketosteroid isomerase-like protein